MYKKMYTSKNLGKRCDVARRQTIVLNLLDLKNNNTEYKEEN